MQPFDPTIQQSQLSFYAHAIGPVYGLLILIAALLSAATTVALLMRGRGPTLVPALMLVVPLPFFVASFSVVGGVMDSYILIANSLVQPKVSEAWVGFGQAIVTAWFGLLMMFPIGMLAVIGGLVRSLRGEKQV
jgi:hypothetical protein